jgi:GrpB-like predicted nucleotidyltransferase (UPF0157 family)
MALDDGTVTSHDEAMLAPYAVQLTAHDPSWSDQAEREGVRLLDAVGSAITSVQHIGSTSIPGILAKPIIDLMGIGPDLETIESARPRFESLGYAWHGDYGVDGRRYCTLTDTATGLRRFHLHCYADGDRSIRRHIAFRDYLRARPDEAHRYERMKQGCAAKHPADSNAYTACKDRWITRVEAAALKSFGW